MTFNDYAYTRPDFETLKAQFETDLKHFEEATDVATQIAIFKTINAARTHVQSMQTLSSIRHSIDTTDAFYEGENNYWDEQGPLYEELNVRLYQAVLKSSFVDELKKAFPKPFFQLAENALKSFTPEIIPLLQEENKLSSQYAKLIASAQIPFDGKTLTLAQLGPYFISEDRSIREAAQKAKSDWMSTNEAAIDDIYDQLVHLRDKIAKTLGFPTFVELGYVRMNRLDYNADMVANFRKQVREGIVPVAQKLIRRQAKRLGLDHLYYYDLPYEFKSGNPKPVGTPEDIIEAGRQMYHELSPETGEFIDFMIDRNLLDLVAKKGKESGGYCTYISDYASPFIFSNFNGTQGDVEVLTHEAGHAFQVFQSRWIDIPEVQWPTLESCEIHSMSMEFLTWPWMDRFFKEQTPKFKFSHLASAMTFIPYGVLIDHFQHEVYAHPDMTPTQRKAKFRELEHVYLPHKDYKDNDFLNRGGFWFQQGHIFHAPFYYIDYTLAQLCALQFFKRTQDNDPTVWSDYLALCKLGGTKSFLGLVEAANLKSPFSDGTVASITSTIENALNAIPDTELN
jgi:M3 family oligoendopeptidase